MLKKFLVGVSAVALASTMTVAANLSILSGSQYSEPSQILATVNTLIQNINAGVSGRLGAFITDTGTTTTAGESTLYSYSLPGGTLATAGDAVRVSCWGTSASNANLKTVKLYFGNQFVSTANATLITASQFNNVKWRLSLTVMRSGAATQVVMGDGAVSATPVAVYSAAGTETNASAITVKCVALTPTATQDVTASGMLVEQVK